MNRILADALTFLNPVFAIISVVATTYTGFRATASFAPLLGIVLGLAAGLLTAILVCGFVSYFALIERHLRKIAEGHAHDHDEERAAAFTRREPQL